MRDRLGKTDTAVHFKMDLKVARAIQAFQASNYSLETVRKLQEGGFDFSLLSGEVVCRLVARNFGLGMKILMDCGIKIDCVDRETGNSPLILLAADGLCGPIRYLIDNLPESHLCHSNQDSKSVLSLLLVRGHGSCGCLEALLQRISPTVLIAPSDSVNRIILSLPDLLESIKTSAIDRVTGVFKLWLSLNYIDLGEVLAGSESRGRIDDALLQRTFGVIIKDCQSLFPNPKSIAFSAYLVFQMILKLLILRQIGVEFLDKCIHEINVVLSTDQPRPLENTQIELLGHIKIRLFQLKLVFEPIMPLKFLTTYALRRYLQCAMRSTTANISISDEEFVFHHQLRDLDLPHYLHQMVLMQDDIYCR